MGRESLPRATHEVRADPIARRIDASELRGALLHAVGPAAYIVDLVAHWDEAVGAALAPHSSPRQVVGTTLVVSVDSTAAGAAMRLRDSAIKEFCRAAFDLIIDRVQVRVGVQPPRRER